ncbi:hypothetical protein [Micromonospora arborensis]|uniref:hypothetical protein n=1 Tax=Micromonospora arborensis TaxID=2116518 RepID=UPI003722D1DD
MYEVGNAFIQIIPSFEHIEKHLARGAKDIADVVGKAVGDALPAGFEDGVRKGSEQAEKQARTGGRKAAASYMDHFSDLLQKRMQSVARALPELKVDGDLSAFDQRLSEARRRVLDLAGAPLALDVDAAKTLRDVGRLRNELRQLRAQTSDSRLRLDLDVATAQVDKFLDEAHSVTERLGRDFSGAFDKILQNGLGKALTNLPDAEIGVDTDSAERRITQLRRVLEGLSEQTVGVDINERDAMTVLHGVRRELDELSRTAESFRLRINADQALRAIDATMAKLVTAAEEEAAKAAADKKKQLDKQAEQERKDRIKAAERERAELARADREEQQRRQREAQQYWREQTKLAEQHIKEKRRLQEKAAQDEKRTADRAAREQDQRNREAAKVAEEEFSRTFAGRIGKHLEKAFSALPAVDLHVNASDADFALKSIRDELKSLRSMRIGVDIEAAEAQARIAFIKGELIELARSNPTIDVHANAIAAATELAEVERIATRIDGKDVNLKVHSTGAEQVQRVGQEASVSLSRLEQLIAVGVSVGTSLVPAAAAAATAIGFIGTAAASVTAGFGVMALGFTGIGDAVQAMQKLDEDTAKSHASNARAANQVVSSIEAITSAERALANVRANNADAARRAAQAIEAAERAVTDARREAAEAIKQAVEKQEDAERTLSRAHIDAREAREGLTRAYRDAIDALADMDSAVKRNALDQRQATLDIKEAKEELDKILLNPRATEEEREQARVTYERRLQQLKDLERQGKELARQQDDANKKGVDGSDQVVAARDRIAQADERVAAAQRSLDRAREDVLRAQVDGQRRIADAQRQVSEAQLAQQSQTRQAAYALAQAQQSLAAAHRQAEQAAVRQGVAGGEAMSNLETAMDKLSPAAQRFAKFLFGLRDEVKSLRDSASTNMLPGVQSSIETLLPYLPRFRDYIGRVATSIGNMFEATTRFLTTDPTWRRFFGFIDKNTVPTLERLYRMGRDVVTGLAGLYLAFTPFNGDIGGGLERLTARFALWATTLEQNEGFQRFLAYARENGPRVVELISQLVEFAARFVAAAAPTGTLVVSAFTALVQVLNLFPMPVLQLIVALMAAWSAGLLLLNLRSRLLAVNASLTNRLLGETAKVTAMGAVGAEALGTATERAADRTGRLGKAMDGTRRATSLVRTGVGNLAGFLGGPWGLAIAGATVLISYFAQKSAEQKQKVNDLADALMLLGKAYKETRSVASSAVRDVVAQSKELQNLVNNANSYGVSIEKIAKAAAGEKAAQDAVIASLRARKQAVQEAAVAEAAAGAESGLVAHQRDEEYKKINLLIGALERQFGELNRVTDAQQALEQAQRDSVDAATPAQIAQEKVGEAMKVLADTTSTAIDKANALKAAQDALSGAAKSQTEAEEAYEAAVDNVAGALTKKNNSLDKGTVAGRANRDAVQALLDTSLDMYHADIAAGVGVAEATRRHEERIRALRDEAAKVKANKAETEALIATYGKVPTDVETLLTLSGNAAVDKQLANLAIQQKALDKNISYAESKRLYEKDKRLAMMADGGLLRGPGSGTSDDILLWGSNGEFMQRADAVSYYGVGFMEAINQRKIPREVLPGFATGGLIQRWPFNVDVSKTDIPKIDVAPARTSGGIGSADMMKILRRVFPGLAMLSGYRPGSKTNSGSDSYHARTAKDGDKGRAVDVPPRMDVFNWLTRNYPDSREIIHTPAGDRQVWNGRRHVFQDPFVRKTHYDHVHWAYDSGGYLPPGVTTVYNGTGRPEPVLTAPQWDEISALVRNNHAEPRGGETHHWHFAKADLDHGRLQAWADARDARARPGRPN